MNLLGPLLDGDTRLLALHQRAYNYVWDRWGIYVGTFRTWFSVMIFSGGIVNAAYQMVTRQVPMIVSMIALLVTFIMIWFLYARKHMTVEWKLQHDGSYKKLNDGTSHYHGMTGLSMRCLIVLVILALLTWLDGDASASSMVPRAIGIGMFVAYTYACGVMVRDREPDRFRQTVPQGA